MNQILATVDAALLEQALNYAVAIIGSMFGIIIVMIGLVYNQVQKVIDLIRKQVDEQGHTHQVQVQNLEDRADSCRNRSESAHKAFYGSIEALKERVVRIETQLDERTQS
jgi:hypothetical protein